MKKRLGWNPPGTEASFPMKNRREMISIVSHPPPINSSIEIDINLGLKAIEGRPRFRSVIDAGF